MAAVARELVVLGTSSAVPTRTRNHNGYLLRWGSEGLLFDPGEGTQRQLTLAGAAASSVTRICLTHAHGDHCLGVPGVLQRMGLDGVRREVPLSFPAGSAPAVEALLAATEFVPLVPVARLPLPAEPAVVARGPGWTLTSAPLAHRVPAVGYRLQEDDGLRVVPSQLAALGLSGPAVGRLLEQGSLEAGGRLVTAAEVTEPRPGQSVAVVMDTAWTDAAVELARGADLLLCESTYLDRDRHLAERYRHLTARQAGELAAAAGVRRLVLTHFSPRYGDSAAPFADEAAEVFPDVVAADDLDRIPLPPRRPGRP